MSDLAVCMDNMSVCYGNTPALSQICLEVREGEYLGVIGPNGGGKSTLLRAILGLIPVCGGSVGVYGGPPGKSREPIGYVAQYCALDRRFPITPLEAVLMGRLKPPLPPFHRFKAQDREAAEALLEKMGLADLTRRRISELSGGQFQKMLIARALAVSPRLLLLDEPTANVDARSREQIYDMLARLNREMTIILVTHDLSAVSTQANRLACLNGRLVYHGKPELNEDIMAELYGCPIARGLPLRPARGHEEEKRIV